MNPRACALLFACVWGGWGEGKWGWEDSDDYGTTLNRDYECSCIFRFYHLFVNRLLIFVNRLFITCSPVLTPVMYPRLLPSSAPLFLPPRLLPSSALTNHSRLTSSTGSVSTKMS
jgi:hypothetical protein